VLQLNKTPDAINTGGKQMNETQMSGIGNREEG